MDRDREFTISLPDGGAYKFAILREASVASDDGRTTATLDWLGVSGEGADETEAYHDLMGSLNQALQDEGNRERFFERVRTNGRKLTEDEFNAEQDEQVRQTNFRHKITDDEQYQVQLLHNTEIVRESGKVTIRGFGVEAAGDDLRSAVQPFLDALNTHIGEVDAPGPGFDDAIAWIREHGERIPEESLREERETQEAWERTKDVIPGITPDDIEKESSQGVPLLVDFWAEWCAPCRMITPVLTELASEWEGRIRIRKIDVEQFDGVWERFGFRGIPAMLMFRDGEEIHRVIGFGGREALVSELEPHLA